MTDYPEAVREYRELQWVPAGEMGFDPGGREVKHLADAAIAALKEMVEKLQSSQQLCIVYHDEMLFENEVVAKLEKAEAEVARRGERANTWLDRYKDKKAEVERLTWMLDELVRKEKEDPYYFTDNSISTYLMADLVGMTTEVEASKYPCTEAELEDAIVRAEKAEAEVERLHGLCIKFAAQLIEANVWDAGGWTPHIMADLDPADIGEQGPFVEEDA